jgi:glycosyltransferase involved in cell wall biosynthesis
MNHATSRGRPERPYQLIIGLGRAMMHLTEGLPDNTKLLYITTGMEGGLVNERVASRVANVERERGCHLDFSRKDTEITRHLSRFDALICLGNEVTASTYRPHFDGPIHLFNNHGYDETAFLPEDKDFEQARRHFLFFTGTQKLLNGLDLVLKVFAARPALNLHVYGNFRGEQDFVACFDRELNRTPNIHKGEWIAVGGSTYRQAVTTCCAIVVPACAAGQSGSVVVCMNNGVIPIVTAEAGIDTDGFGIALDSYSMGAVATAVDRAASAPTEWHREMARRTYERARRDFSQAAFTRRFRQIFEEVLPRP